MKIREFGNIIYGLIQEKMKEYIIPEIKKENFIEMFNKGELIINQLQLKKDKNINLNSQFIFNFFSCEEFKAIIPDENSNLEFYMKNSKGYINLIELDYTKIEETLISNMKNFTEKFINYAVGIVENSSNWKEGTIQNIINKILQGLKFKIENIELNLKFNDTVFICSIGNILYDENEGIKIDNINLRMKDNNLEINIINDFGFEIKINYSEVSQKKENELILNFNSFEMELDKRVLKKVKEMIQIIQYNMYKQLYYKMKRLIEYYKPKKGEEGYYKKLWYFSIKTIINLRKYYTQGKLNNFDFSQKKIMINYYNNININDIILLNKKNILLFSKEKIEKTVIENKNKGFGNFLALFRKKEENNQLTENEKEKLDNFFNIDNIENFLNDKIENKNSNVILGKILTFMNNLIVYINFPNISLKLIDEKNELNLSLKEIEVTINKNSDFITSKFILKDIVYLNDISFFNEKIDENAFVISLLENGKIDVKFNFKNIQLDENIFIFILVYYLSSNVKKNFKKIFKENIINLNINKDDIFTSIEKINFPIIPSLSLFNKEDRITVSLKDVDVKKDFSNISFNYHIKNNKGDILPLYNFKIIKEKDKNTFKFDLDKPLNLILNKAFVSFILNLYKKINKINEDNIPDNNNEFVNDNDERFNYFNFNFEEKGFDIRELDYQSFNFDLQIKYLYIELNEMNCQSKLKIKELNLKYINQKFELKLDDIQIITDKKSSFLLYILQYEPESAKNIVKIKLTEKDFYEALKEVNPDSDFNSNNETKNLFNDLFLEFNLLITKIILTFQDDDYVLNLVFNELIGKKTLKEILMEFSSCYLSLIDYKISQENEIVILKANEKIICNYDFINGYISGKMNNPEGKLTMKIFFQIYKSFNFIVDNINFDFILVKYDLEVNNLKIDFNRFFINANRITLRNYLKGSNDVSLIKIFDFNVENKKTKNNVIKEKEIDVNILFKPQNDRLYYLIFKDLNVSLTQIYLYKFILSFHKEYNLDDYKKQSSNINLFDFQLEFPEEKKNKYKIEYNIEIYKFNLFLCLENFEKISEISFKKSNVFININSTEDINVSNHFIEEINYTIQIEEIALIFFDNQNQKINVLTNISKKDFEITKETIPTLEYQIKIIIENNIIKIDIFLLEILVRLDSFLCLYLYFKNAIPIDLIISEVQKSQTPQIILSIFNSKFILQTSFDGRENMILSINELYVGYNKIKKLKLPFGEYFIQIKSIVTEFVTGANKRELFHTKNYFLIFKSSITDDLINFKFEIQSLYINLSYIDVTSFLKSYQLNYFYYKNEKRIENNQFSQKENNELLKSQINENNIIFKSKTNLTGAINLSNLDIVLIDNSTGSYYPFINISLSDFYIQIPNNSSLEMNVFLAVNSFNYIACIWEPSIEKTLIKFQFFRDEKTRMIFEIKELLINVSDMNISFIIGSLSNWIKKFMEEKSNYEHFISDPLNFKLIKENESNISNNEVFNNTGELLKIKYAGQVFELKNQQRRRLEYIMDWNEELYGKKEIIVIYNEIFSFSIPIEKLGTRRHTINNSDFFISENTLSKERHINISIYSPIIFRNKTNYDMTVIFISDKLTYFPLNKEKIVGIPFKLIGPKIKFYFVPGIHLIEDYNNKDSINQIFNLNEIQEKKTEEKYKIQFMLEQKYLILSLEREILNVRELIILSEYSIINCLPVEIGINIKGIKYKIPKCSQFFLDFNQVRKFSFEILANDIIFNSQEQYFFSLNNQEQENNKNYVYFYNKIGYSFFLSSIIINNSSGTQLIIYAETLIKNNSGIYDLDIVSNMNNKPFIFRLNKELFLVRSSLDFKENQNLRLISGVFRSDKIQIKDLLSSKENYFIKMRYEESKDINYNLDLSINSNLSHILIKDSTFNENIMSMIISINPTCKFLSLLTNKSFYIADFKNKKENIRIFPMQKVNFNFFNRGKSIELCFGLSNIKENFPKEWSDSFIINSYGLFTLYLSDLFINLEIRQDPIDSNLEVFISEANIDNCKITVENKSFLTIAIYQENYDQYIQIIEPNEKIMLRVFSYNKPVFLVDIKNKIYLYQFKNQETNNIQNIGNEIILHTISNRIKKHLIFYNYDKIKKNKIIEQPKNDFYILNINVNHLGISIIGDNEQQNNKLSDYKRKEILFFYMKNINIYIDKNIEEGSIIKDETKSVFYIEKIHIYNQSIENGKYFLVLTNKAKNNNNFLTLKINLISYLSDKVSEIKEFNIELDKIKLSLDPDFITSIIDFISNIIYRLDLKDYNVDNIFLFEKKEDDVFEEYKKQLTIYTGKNLVIPPLNISFELSSININNLIQNYLKYSSFYSFVFKGLTGNKHNVNTNSSSIEHFVGNYQELLMIILNKYNFAINGEISNIAIKGFLFGLFKFITKDDSKIKTNDVPNRIRKPRALYGKYQYFKNYDKDDAEILEKLKQSYAVFKNNYYYFTRCLKGQKFIYIFTNLSLYVMNSNLQILNNIDYFVIKDIKVEKDNIIKVNYNQDIDKLNYSTINCENINIRNKLFNILKEQTNLYSDEILFIN